MKLCLYEFVVCCTCFYRCVRACMSIYTVCLTTCVYGKMDVYLFLYTYCNLCRSSSLCAALQRADATLITFVFYKSLSCIVMLCGLMW